ncbi:MAG: hypothetical protein WKF87_08160 [Chryseolinea sp.]
MNVAVPKSLADELDGVPFIGDISLTNLNGERRGDKVFVRWIPVSTEGKVEIRTSTTNNFANGGPDTYKVKGKAKVSAGSYMFNLPGQANPMS